MIDEEGKRDRRQAAGLIKQQLKTEEGQQDVVAMALAELMIGQQELKAEITGLKDAVIGATSAMTALASAIEKNGRSFT